MVTVFYLPHLDMKEMPRITIVPESMLFLNGVSQEPKDQALEAEDGMMHYPVPV